VRSGTQRIDSTISQAFYLRRYLLPSLLRKSHVADSEPLDSSIFFSPAGWHLFLRVERCAYPLRRLFEASGFENALPGEFREILDDEADWEWRRIQSAMAQLEEIQGWALANDARPIVLKGGLAVVGDMPLDLNDLDILLPAADCERLFGALVGAGYSPRGSAGRFCRNQLWRDGALAVEIHHGIHDGLVYPPDGYWPGMQPVTGFPGLWRLSPIDNLWHVLLHNVDKSPTHRGRIRDLLLMRAASRSCSPEDIAVLRDRVDERALSYELHATLDCVLDPDVSADAEFLDGSAMLSYLLGNRPENRSRVYPTAGMVNEWVFALLAGRIERRAIWSGVLVRAPGVSKIGIIRRLQRSVPAFGRAVHVLMRSAWRLVTLVRGSLIAIRCRRLRTRYLQHCRDRYPGITAR